MAASLLTLAWMLPAGSQPSVGFGWFEPWVEIDADDVRKMDRGRIVAKSLPGDGREIAVFLATAINTSADTFIDAARHPEHLWKAARVPRVGRFSMPPRLEDVADMRLDSRDVEAIRRCVPGDCEVKLGAAEIQRLQVAASIQDEFRQLVVERVRRYLEGGLRATDDFYDDAMPIDPAAISAGLLMRSPWLTERAPRLAEYVEDFPVATLRDVDSFVYWLETTHTPRPTVQVVHVMIARRSAPGVVAPEVLVVSRQVFASHYINGSLAVSILFQDRAYSRWYLTYVNRLDVDGLGGLLGGLRRLFLERAARDRGADALAEQRRRIEGWRVAAARTSQ